MHGCTAGRGRQQCVMLHPYRAASSSRSKMRPRAAGSAAASSGSMAAPAQRSGEACGEACEQAGCLDHSATSRAHLGRHSWGAGSKQHEVRAASKQLAAPSTHPTGPWTRQPCRAPSPSCPQAACRWRTVATLPSLPVPSLPSLPGLPCGCATAATAASAALDGQADHPCRRPPPAGHLPPRWQRRRGSGGWALALPRAGRAGVRRADG